MISSRLSSLHSKERLPLLEPLKKGKSSSPWASLGQSACVILGIFLGIGSLYLLTSILRTGSHTGHDLSHRTVHHASKPSTHSIRREGLGCISPASVASYHDVDALFTKHGSPRGSAGPAAKDFHKLYGSLFMRQRTTSDLVIEMGARRPGLLTWRDYFSKARIVGIDMDPRDAMYRENRIVTVSDVNTTSPLSSPEIELHRYKVYSRADIIIDNGDHDPTTQGDRLETMYEMLRTNGIYVVEGFPSKPSVIGGGHHFCQMPFQRPFVFGLHQEERRVRRNFTSPKLESLVAENDVFYAAMQPGVSTSNAMVMLKNESANLKQFHNMPHNYQVVYNALLGSVPIRALSSFRPLHGQTTGVGCGVPNGIEVFMTSIRDGSSKKVIHDFMAAKTGSFLFVEDASFSFCDGAPPSSHWGTVLQAALAANPDWFYAMTDEDTVRDAKMIVIRKH